jgi:hypothetical protein
MTIEQRPELNRFVDPSIPLTWNWRWRQFKMTLPVWIFIWVCFLEMSFLQAWLANRLGLNFMLTVFGACLFILFMCFGMAETLTRIQQRSKRVIQFLEKKIIVKPAKNQLVRWKNVAKFQFEPVAESPGLTKLNLFLSGRSVQRTPKRAFWRMVLENAAQAQDVERYLRNRKTQAPAAFEIEILERPSPPAKPVPYPYLGTSLYMGGVYFLLHGGLGLLVSLTGGQHDSGGDSKFTPEQRAKLGHFLAGHFSSKEQLHRFFLTLNISLTVAGIGLLILGWRLMRRKPQLEPAAQSA